MSFLKEVKSSELDSAIKAFKLWRSSREKRCRIPAHLWQLAADLSIQYNYPLNTICRKLGLNWGDLKKKIIQLTCDHPVTPHAPSSFLELKLPGQAPSPLFNQSSRCAVELMKPDGTMMKIYSSADSPLNVMELCKTFLGNGQ